MKPINKSSEELVKVKKSSLLTLIADKLKDRTLFPEKVEVAKKLLNGNKAISS